MEGLLKSIADFLWGAPVLILIFIVGFIYSIKTKFFQFRKFGFILKNTGGEIFKKSDKVGEGTLTPLQAVSTALAGCVGTANIAGVATAIFLGGPGAVFWMWVVSLFGMLTKCVEVTLAQYYRIKGEDGIYYGGPMYYIEKGLGKKWKPLAVIFSITIVLGGLGTAAFVQPYAISSAVENAFSIPSWVTITVCAVICGLVLIGGVKGIGKFCEKITPLMCVLYIVFALGILIVNFKNIPAAFGMIFKYAFTPFAAVGGMAGSAIALTVRQGAARGTFSNEAGCGTSPITHATAITPHPMKEGLYGAFEVFVDTLLVCTCTALVILVSDTSIWQSGLKDVQLTMAAFSSVYSGFGNIIVTLCLTLFAFSTMVGWEINYESAFFYMFPKKTKIAKFLLRVVWLVPGFLTLGKAPEVIWTVVDISSGLWCIPNSIALILLSKKFMEIYYDFEKKYISLDIKK
ncbi:alanine/glycine:cation symporter family protein [Miniphocaeibacter massiliensis]|uniref:alanine/glycine:cation symporter family protein n=1 Tax=Miniphocaeibacter massiliensis TaxID=2041841 RepID=UPI000C1B9E22|nr:sodium:alanine symporter family protein [Miniphocaeibacter massiliensis]